MISHERTAIYRPSRDLYRLDAIQASVEGNSKDLEKSNMYMYSLKEQAIGLMSQPLNSTQNTELTFEYPAS